MATIIDCYTDEPAGLGVPPYLGVYPRYIAGKLISNREDFNYLTIDDLRFFNRNNSIKKNHSKNFIKKTDIFAYNLTRDLDGIRKILEDSDEIIVIAGVHTPGKYLSAVPGTLREIVELLKDISSRKILAGPAVFGSSTQGGRFSEKVDLSCFDETRKIDFSYDELRDIAVTGASVIKQIPDLRIIEIETAKGCPRKEHCSFCTEPIKNKLSFRDKADIVKEVKELYRLGVMYFRLGKQSDYYSHPEAVQIIKEIRKECPLMKVLHIDNVNPISVVGKKGIEITKAIVKYCTEGNTAAFGVESFDPDVVKDNKLNSNPESTYEAVKILNKYGRERGKNGMPKFLPGINILFGLISESKKTNEYNVEWLKRFLSEDLWLRRINIRQVDIFEGTPLYNTVGNKFIKKNKKFYWKWRNEIRQNIDYEMLKKIVPKGLVLKDVRAEIYDGNTTFCRQVGTYPLIVGVKERLELKKFYDVEVVGHMLRSCVGKVINSK